MSESRPPPLPPTLVLATGLVAISFSAILVRLAQNDAPSLVIAAGRLTFAGLILLPPALLRRRAELRALAPADWRLLLVAGFCLSLHFATWITSLEHTSVATSTVLVTTSPLWVGLASPLVLGERLPRLLKVGIGLALFGSVVIGLEAAGGGAGDRALWGNFLALLGALTAAAYFLIGRYVRPRLSLLSYTTIVYGTAALWLLLYVLLARLPFLGYRPDSYLLILLMALFPQLIGHSSYNWALGYLPAAFVIVTLVSEPVGAGLLAFLFFRELPAPLALLGSALILAGIYVASRATSSSHG